MPHPPAQHRDHRKFRPRLLSSASGRLASDSDSGGLLAVPYGVLIAFLAIALLWWADSRSTITYGMDGPMTTITLGGNNLSTEEQEIEAARELRAFLAEKDVSMIKVSEGDAPPTLVVFDPGRRIGWTAQLDDADAAPHREWAWRRCSPPNSWP